MFWIGLAVGIVITAVAVVLWLMFELDNIS